MSDDNIYEMSTEQLLREMLQEMMQHTELLMRIEKLIYESWPRNLAFEEIDSENDLPSK